MVELLSYQPDMNERKIIAAIYSAMKEARRGEVLKLFLSINRKGNPPIKFFHRDCLDVNPI